jgi:heme exporter protein C
MMFIMFGVVLLLRNLISDPARRLTLSAVAAILAFVDVPIVYFSVKWWNSLHQPWSSPETVSQTMHLPLRMAAFGMLFIAAGFIAIRWKTIRVQLEAETRVPDLPDRPEPLQLDEEGESA